MPKGHQAHRKGASKGASKKEGKRGSLMITSGLSNEMLETTVAAAEIEDDTVARAKGNTVYQAKIPGDKRAARALVTALTEE